MADQLVFAAPLSRTSSCTMIVRGPFGKREARNLLTLLEVQVSCLQDDEGEGNAEYASWFATPTEGTIP